MHSIRSLPALLALSLPAPAVHALPLGTIRLPDGFAISVAADGLRKPRQMSLADDGTLFVGSTSGDVTALRDGDGDGRFETRHRIARDLRLPAGVAFHDGDLYVSAVSRILRYPGITAKLPTVGEPETVTDALPSDGHHGLKHIAFGPDGRLYVPIGAPCNVCDRDGYARLTSMSRDGEDVRVEALGIRNTVGFDWQPGNSQLWFSDNGRDWLGDDSPDDELNRVSQRGEHFGFPHCHADGIVDPEFGDGQDCADYSAPVFGLGAHVASLGIHFYRGKKFPERYRGALFIAEHGSWNRSSKVGYRVTVVRFENGQPQPPEAFAEGWLDGQRNWGRPVALTETAGGDLLLSDDQAGVIYRIGYDAPES
ncbi:MAG: PQQ-dependent sugar dehydrogenase [Lysobacteraceae bacterium]